MPNARMRLTSWPRAFSSLKTASGIVASRFSLLKPALCGQNDPWKCSVWKRGHSNARCRFGYQSSQNSTTLRKAWMMVWSWLSPPGVPSAISGVPSLKTRLGVSV